MYIENINSPKDLKGLTIDQLNVLADEVREGVLNRVSEHGGHVGPNLGFTEATVALHYVFNAPEDKIVFDISHQSYPHKMLTGRKEGFLDVAKMDGISGYSSPLENPEYDNFEVGHTSTSVALASGLMKGRDVLGGHENVIAVIGDGSLSGGEAFEGLDTVGEIGTNAIIIFNDNEMSISENHGGIYRNLQELRETNGQAANNLFKAFGLDYIYVSLKNPGNGENMTALLGQWMAEQLKKDPKMVCIAAGTAPAFYFDKERREEAGKQFIDVGIAEEEGVAIASAMAKRGAHPVFSTFATFLQRTYDQLSQDLAVNGNPAVINVLGSSIYGMNDFTHICFFDIPMLSHIPNLVYLAPTTYEELIAMETWAIQQEQYSVAIRVPAYGCAHSLEEVDTDYSQLNKYKVAHRGEKVAVIAVGDFYQKGEAVVNALANDGIDATLINPRYLSGEDEALLNDLKKDHQLVATIEDGSLDGGFGERIARFYGPSDMKVINFGVKKQLYDRYDVNELLRENHLTEEQIVADIKAIL